MVAIFIMILIVNIANFVHSVEIYTKVIEYPQKDAAFKMYRLDPPVFYVIIIYMIPILML